MSATVASTVALISLDDLAKAMNERFPIVVGYRVLGGDEKEEKKVHQMTFKNARLIIHEIPRLLADATVSELCICANEAEASEVGTLIARAPQTRLFKRTSVSLPDKGKGWTFVFQG